MDFAVETAHAGADSASMGNTKRLTSEMSVCEHDSAQNSHFGLSTVLKRRSADARIATIALN